jgi:hypothetical protein
MSDENKIEVQDTEASSQTKSSLRDLVEKKGLDVFLSEDEKSLVVKSSMKFGNAGKRAVEDYMPTERELTLINEKFSNVDLLRRASTCFYPSICRYAD